MRLKTIAMLCEVSQNLLHPRNQSRMMETSSSAMVTAREPSHDRRQQSSRSQGTHMG